MTDVATPRPREVGGACRIQVLATARTQDTVGGSNGAKRSEFRRSCPPVRVTQDKSDASKSSSVTHRTGNGASVTRRKPVMPSSFKPRVQIQPFCPRRPSYCSSRVQIVGFAPVDGSMYADPAILPPSPFIDVVPNCVKSPLSSGCFAIRRGLCRCSAYPS